MSETNPTRDEVMGALFAQLVLQQTNMAMMLLGKMPHPQTGETAMDLEAAKFFIDQLEMLEVKTKGNLNKEEETLLKQSLMSLRMSFVDAVAQSEKSTAEPQRAEEQASASPRKQSAAPKTEDTKLSEESQKKFVKKY